MVSVGGSRLVWVRPGPWSVWVVCGWCGWFAVGVGAPQSVVSVGAPRSVVDVPRSVVSVGGPWSLWVVHGLCLVWMHCSPVEGHLVAARISVL